MWVLNYAGLYILGKGLSFRGTEKTLKRTKQIAQCQLYRDFGLSKEMTIMCLIKSYRNSASSFPENLFYLSYYCAE